MSLFRDLGEKVERFKRTAVDASEEQAEFACRACEQAVYTDQETCPHCGADAVVRLEGDAESPESEPGNSEPDDDGEVRGDGEAREGEHGSDPER